MTTRKRLSLLTPFSSQGLIWGLVLALAAGSLGAQQPEVPIDGRELPKPEAKAEPALPEAPADGVLPIGRAWELSHYRVRVWMMTDGSAALTSLLPGLMDDIRRESIRIDASGWELLVGKAPNPWFWRCARYIQKPEALQGIESLPELKFDDKLMLVLLRDTGLGIETQVRELDLTTRQWGALQSRLTPQPENLAPAVTDAIRFAFMPLANIEVVPMDSTAVLRARGLDSSLQTRMDEQLNWVTSRNTGSPVSIREEDNFLPVLRRVDRSGKLESLEAVDYTFINTDKIEGTKITGYVHSSARAPLSGRTSKRLQKLALVIRPQPRPTRLRLVALDNPKQPMEGLEVYSRRTDAQKDAPSELLGKTDWRGVIDIPPGDEALRLIYLKRGTRALKKVPLIPGFRDQLATEVPNDEARLFAEGVILGVQTEILDLVVQREVYEQKIAAELENNNLTAAQDDLVAYEQLPTAQKLASTLADEEARLTIQAKSKKEIDFIKIMFGRIRDVLQTKVANTKEAELRQKIQSGGSKQP
ncbi:MAG: hypothetical protein ACK57U_05680 [Planctomycetota bacterium]